MKERSLSGVVNLPESVINHCQSVNSTHGFCNHMRGFITSNISLSSESTVTIAVNDALGGEINNRTGRPVLLRNIIKRKRFNLSSLIGHLKSLGKHLRHLS